MAEVTTNQQSFTKGSGLLYLIPTIIAEGTQQEVIPPAVINALKVTDYFLVEELRTARRFISSLKIGKEIGDLKFYVVDKDTPETRVVEYFKEIPPGQNIGVLSEAGCPGIADPGAVAVAAAHKLNRKVVPLTGPSSILLALMASGFSGQSFVFHGYVPIEPKERTKKLQQMEKDAFSKQQTQIFMDTPYRNNQLLKDLITSCKPDTSLCIAANLTASNETVHTRKIRDWKKITADYHKQPALFLIYSH